MVVVGYKRAADWKLLVATRLVGESLAYASGWDIQDFPAPYMSWLSNSQRRRAGTVETTVLDCYLLRSLRGPTSSERSER